MPSPRRIDVHFHLIPEFYSEAVYAAGRGPAIGRYPDWTPELALELMEAHGIEVALTSLAQPGVGFVDARTRRGAGAALQRICVRPGGALARAASARSAPCRWATSAPRSRKPLHCLDVLKHDGVSLFASYGEQFLGDPFFDPLMETLDAQGAVVFVHPGLHPSSKDLALPWPAFMMEYLFDTTRAAVNLLFSGALDRFPAHPVHPAACRRRDAVLRLAARGVADDRQAAAAAFAGRCARRPRAVLVRQRARAR